MEGKFSLALCTFKTTCLHNCAGRFMSSNPLNRGAGYVELSITIKIILKPVLQWASFIINLISAILRKIFLVN